MRAHYNISSSYLITLIMFIPHYPSLLPSHAYRSHSSRILIPLLISRVFFFFLVCMWLIEFHYGWLTRAWARGYLQKHRYLTSSHTTVNNVFPAPCNINCLTEGCGLWILSSSETRQIEVHSCYTLSLCYLDTEDSRSLRIDRTTDGSLLLISSMATWNRVAWLPRMSLLYTTVLFSRAAGLVLTNIDTETSWEDTSSPQWPCLYLCLRFQ